MDFRPYVAELIGTFVLVFGGCGAAILAGGGAIGLVGISFAFGLSLLAMAYAIGPVSGCHINPAVSLGLALAGRFSWKRLPGYVVAQVLGAIAASWLLYYIASHTAAGTDPSAGGFASNGYELHSPAGYKGEACFVAEVVLTFLLVFTVLGATAAKAPAAMAGIPIGMVLVLIHLVGIPITNTSVNPARSTGPATVAGGWALEQLWMFWLAPCLGALLAAMAQRFLERPPYAPPPPPPDAPHKVRAQA